MNTSPEFKGIKTLVHLFDDPGGEMNTSPEFKGIKTALKAFACATANK